MGGAILPDRRIGPAAEAAWGGYVATFQKEYLPARIGPVSGYSEDFTSAGSNLPEEAINLMITPFLRG